MNQDWLSYIAPSAIVAFGAIILGSVLRNYLRNVQQHSPSLSISLSLIGFILVSSPVWGSIVVKGPGIEISVYENQLEKFVELADLYQQCLPPQQATDVAPAINELRASVRDLKVTAGTKKIDMKKVNETVKFTEKLTRKAKGLHP